MPLVAGVDEAGYGPKLGPMTVAAFGLSVPGPGPEPLHRCLGGDFPVPVRDSKSLFSPRRGLRRLEESALTLLALATGRLPATGGELAGLLFPQDRDDVAALPWYRQALEETLPVEAERTRLEDLAGRAAEHAGRHGLGAGLARASVFTERRLNEIWLRHPNKQAASLAALKRLLPAVAAGDGALVAVDQQGGRRRYAGWLAQIFGPGPLQRRQRAPGSAYHLPAKNLTVLFQPAADARHPTVAAAGIIAKYLRELLMGSFYRFWRSRGLEPADGYGGRYRAFLAAARRELPRLGLDAGVLLRRH